MLISLENDEIKIVINKQIVNEIKNVFSGIRSIIRLAKNFEIVSSNKEINKFFKDIIESITNINEEDLDIDNLFDLPNGEYSSNGMFVSINEEDITIIVKGIKNIDGEKVNE
jgi:hypothetical protein